MSSSSHTRPVALFRQLVRLALPGALAIGGTFAVTTAAHADTVTRVLPQGTFCQDFSVQQTNLTPNPSAREISNPSGNRFVGHAVVQYTNLTTGKTVTFNVSGAELISQSGDIITITYTGPAWLDIGPVGQRNTGNPAIQYVTGRTVETVDLSLKPPAATSITTTAPSTDVCKLLAP
jgi:hypothetical protein